MIKKNTGFVDCRSDVGACVHQKFVFFDPFFALFSIPLGNSDALGGIQSNMLANDILMFFWHHFERNTTVTKGVPKITLFVFFCLSFCYNFC